MNEPSSPSNDFLRDLGEAARKNPISAALIGMGALWLFTNHSGNISEAAQDAWEGTKSAARTGGQTLAQGTRAKIQQLRDLGSPAAHQASEAHDSFADSASDDTRGLPDTARNLFQDVRTNIEELFRTQPLALGAVGVAIGAAIAASVPSTEAETAYLGESSVYVKQKVAEIVSDQTGRAAEIGKKVAEAVADEARQQGLSAEALKESARNLSGKVSRVADVATSSLKS